MVQQERCYTGLLLAVDDGPVDRCGPTVLRQQRSVQVESAEPGHCPDNLGQHAVQNFPFFSILLTLMGAECLDEIRRFQFLRLEDRQTD